MDTKHLLLSVLLFILTNHLLSQPNCYVTHYSVDDGLPQHNVMDILQDSKGFIWAATWNGISKFDGYKFITYLSNPQHDNYPIKNNRIDYIYEDQHGYIWIQSYDGKVHRFNPKTETFSGMGMFSDSNNSNFQVSELLLMPSGKIWLLSEKHGCINVIDTLLNIETYSTDNRRIRGNHIYKIYEDKQDNTWLLTDNGVGFIPSKMIEPVMFFSEDNSQQFKQSFFSILELDNELWFGSDNGRIWRYQKNDGQFQLLNLNITSQIRQIEKLDDSQIIIASSGNGIFICDIITEQVKWFHTANSELLSDKIYSFYIDYEQNIWISLDRIGVSKLNAYNFSIKHYDILPEDPNEHFHRDLFVLEDIAQRIWVHPRGGGFSLYDPEKDILLPFNNTHLFPKGISGILYTALCDHQGNLWLSSRSHGLEKVVFGSNHFKVARFDKPGSTVGNDVRAVFEDRDHNTWISTKDGKVRIYDSNRRFKGFLCEDGSVGHGEHIRGIVYCIYQDNNGHMWIGTKGDGLYLLQPAKSGRFKMSRYQYDAGNVYSLSNNNIYSILQDRRGNLWVGTYGGGLNLVEFDEYGGIRFIHYRNRLKNYPIDETSQIRCISEDRSGKICVGTTVGLLMFDSDFALPENIGYRYYSHNIYEESSLNNNDVQNICHTAGGDMYLATFGGGMNKVVARDADGFPVRFKAYTKNDGLPSDVTLSVIDAGDGSLWVSMENNLSRFDPGKEYFETFGEIHRLIAGGIFSEGSTVRLHSGEMLFGFSRGLLSFHPPQISNDPYCPPVVFTGFRLFNKETGIGGDSPLQNHIDHTGKLTLSYKQNFFSIEFAALDYRDPDNILYAYKLEGLDNDWIYAQKQRIANYTNLPKGDYTFCVKTTNSDGVWMDNERRLPVEVLPSFWETPWAYALYCFAFLLILFLGTYILYTIYKLKRKMELETQLSEMKIRFFTDISHEIRTPLTMITAPVDHLIHDRNTPPDIKKQLGFVARNTGRMLHMVNQVLDLRKIQHVPLQVEEIRLVPFIENIGKGFDKLIEKQRFDFRFTAQADVSIWADRDCLEKIIFNLLSNAFKFTPPGKAISVSIRDEDDSVSIAIKDSGKGIDSEKQKQIFTRFISFNEDKDKPSTGIGLSMVKELADKHHADISVESTPEQGSCFTVTFRKGYAHFGKDVNLVVSAPMETIEENTPVTVADEENNHAGQRPVVLIVEDDEQLRKFLKSILRNDYRIYEAIDGQDGYEKALEIIPDFIVSDLMMPRKDGLQLLQQIKTTINTSHIPVVLLTAKTAIESKLQGLSYGADDYITKPFSVPYFRARIENLLQQRRQLQKLYCSDLLSGSNRFIPGKPEITSHDEELMKKVMEDIEKNMDNDTYSIDMLASSVGVSRTVLSRKVKSLTGLTPVEFIRDIKIQRAAQLLSTRQFSVKEVIYMVGMSDAKYFRQCFRKKYGKSPSEYAESPGD